MIAHFGSAQIDALDLSIPPTWYTAKCRLFQGSITWFYLVFSLFNVAIMLTICVRGIMRFVIAKFQWLHLSHCLIYTLFTRYTLYTL